MVANELTLDLDSTVMTHYGQHEDATRGCNPPKLGRASRHLLPAFALTAHGDELPAATAATRAARTTYRPCSTTPWTNWAASRRRRNAPTAASATELVSRN